MKWEFKQIEPQPARGKLLDEYWDSSEWIAEEKYDGDRRIAQFCDGVVRFTGRKISVKDGLFVEKTANIPHLSGSPDLTPYGCASCAPPPTLDGTVLDGEMVSALDDGGGKSKHVTSIMGSASDVAIQKQIERGWLEYVVFDCLFYKGKDIRQEALLNRKCYLMEAFDEWKNPHVKLASYEDTLKSGFYTSIIARGGEGVVLKHVSHRYGEHLKWVKAKAIATADVFIIGYKPAKEESKKVTGEVSRTKYAGKVGSVQIAQIDNTDPNRVVEVGHARGFDDALMEAFSQDPEKFKGRVIEVIHNGREPSGRFRHPRFSRFRDDKLMADCTFDLEET